METPPYLPLLKIAIYLRISNLGTDMVKRFFTVGEPRGFKYRVKPRLSVAKVIILICGGEFEVMNWAKTGTMVCIPYRYGGRSYIDFDSEDTYCGK